jgi:hypothetical protein
MLGIHMTSLTKLPEISLNIFDIFNAKYVQKLCSLYLYFKQKIIKQYQNHCRIDAKVTESGSIIFQPMHLTSAQIRKIPQSLLFLRAVTAVYITLLVEVPAVGSFWRC